MAGMIVMDEVKCDLCMSPVEAADSFSCEVLSHSVLNVRTYESRDVFVTRHYHWGCIENYYEDTFVNQSVMKNILISALEILALPNNLIDPRCVEVKSDLEEFIFPAIFSHLASFEA